MRQDKLNRYFECSPFSYSESILELQEQLIESTHTVHNGASTDPKLISTVKKEPQAKPNLFVKPIKLREETGESVDVHPDVDLFLKKYFHGEDLYLTEQVISCIVKEYSYLWKHAKTKQILQYFIRSLRGLFPDDMVGVSKILECTRENGLNGLVSEIFNGMEVEESCHPRNKKSSFNLSNTSSSASKSLPQIQRIKKVIEQHSSALGKSIEQEVKSRIQTEMRRLQNKQERIQHLLHLINSRIQELNTRYSAIHYRESVADLTNRIKIQQLELVQAEFIIQTIKEINSKVEGENQRLNQKLEKVNDYLLREHDQELKRYRQMFRNWNRDGSLQAPSSRKSPHQRRNRSVETIQDQDMGESFRKQSMDWVSVSKQEGRKSTQTLLTKKPLQIKLMANRKKG